MYPVSREFEEKIRADERRTYGKIQIDYTDPFLDQSIDITASEQANTSYPQQAADNISAPLAKYASLDGSWVLDGTYALAPGPGEDGQMGWWGSQLSGPGGIFAAPYPKLAVAFFARPIWNLKVVGDSKREEWPVDFTIKLFDEADVLLYTETMIGNTDIAWEKEIDAVNEVAKMELEITKWSHASRQAKILEFFTSIQETYEGDDILMIHVLEEKEVSRGSLPVGNISANEIDIRLSNEDRRFDLGNKQSPIHGLVKANRRIKAWLGIEKADTTKEWVPLGTFWSGDWKAPENEVYAYTTGRDRLELLRKSTYSTSQVQQNKTLYELAIAVLQDAGVKNTEYWVDTELQDFLVPYSYFENQSHREALRKIAEACLGQVYCDREGIIRVEGPSFMENKIAQALGTYFLEGSFPAEIEAIEAYGIGPDDYFYKDNPAKDNEIANYIEVETQPLRPDILREVYRSNEQITITTNKTFTIYYNESPCINAVASLEGTGSITNDTYYAWGADITVSAGTFKIIVNAQPLKVLNKEKAIAQDQNSITDNGLIKYTFPGNPFVQTLSVAQSIADKLLQYYKDPRRDVTMDWRGNPALLLGDLITVPDYQRGSNDVRGYYYITKQEIEYTGALRAKLEGRRAI